MAGPRPIRFQSGEHLWRKPEVWIIRREHLKRSRPPFRPRLLIPETTEKRVAQHDGEKRMEMAALTLIPTLAQNLDEL